MSSEKDRAINKAKALIELLKTNGNKLVQMQGLLSYIFQ